jgi:hypothetical protein
MKKNKKGSPPCPPSPPKSIEYSSELSDKFSFIEPLNP